jgi:outer membrane protein assembly factor BamB
MMPKSQRSFAVAPFLALAIAATALHGAESTDGSFASPMAQKILEDTGITGGMVVVVGCGDGRLTAALGAQGESYLVQGVDTDAEAIAKARKRFLAAGVNGRVSAVRFDGKRLPYIDNLVNLVVSEELGDVAMDEVRRILCPGGTAYVRTGGGWSKTVKPRPDEIDEWTHYMHDASGNAVAQDDVVGPPRRMQWQGSPRYGRHHDKMSSMSACVTAGGRVFYVFDETSPASILSPPSWTLIARDAFNGTILWKRPISTWHTHLWPLKSGPAQLPRRLVSDGEFVFVTLSYDGPVSVLNAVTGETVRVLDDTKGTEEIIFKDNVLVALANPAAGASPSGGSDKTKRAYGAKFWDEEPRQIVAVDTESGKTLWSIESRVLPGTLAANSERVVLHDGDKIVCLAKDSGKEIWQSANVPRAEEIKSFYLPILVLYDDVVLFSGGETAGLQTGSWYMDGKDTLTALSLEDGKEVWKAYHPPSGYRSPEDLLVAGGLVWTGETTSGRAVGAFTGRNPKTGEVECEFEPDVDTYWFHHRCYRGKATENYLLMARTGTEFVDIKNQHWDINHWVRGACLYGVMPANGLLYTPQHPCACYLESKQSGFNALAPAASDSRLGNEVVRLEKGPAYKLIPPIETRADNWPTYRQNAGRSGQAATVVPTALKTAWEAEIGGKLSSPVVADGSLYVASIDTHTVMALNADSGETKWQFTAGGRVDSPPTYSSGLVLFGCADGYVYCLRAGDGELCWRFLAAPTDQRLTSFEQVESAWPVHGSVLLEDGVAYFVAGRSIFLDGGLHLWRLDPMSGEVLSETVLNEKTASENPQTYTSWLNMPPALPDILSSDGRLVYMRSQPFTKEGKRLPLEAMPMAEDADKGAPPAAQQADRAHLFSPTGFLDDTWWHRTYWMYGSTFISGWCGYFKSGQTAPAGRILVYDDENVYGFGRKPQYYRWTTPIEHQLFSAERISPGSDTPESAESKLSVVRVAKSSSLNPTKKPVTISAWVNSENADGVVLARGGNGAGYVLWLKGGKPNFGVRMGGELSSIGAKQRIVGEWAHLAAVLTPEKQMRLYIDGKLAASGEAKSLIGGDPAEAMEIGIDDSSIVGDYAGPAAFGGLIDEVRLYDSSLSKEQIAELAAGRKFRAPAPTLAYSFDDGNARDESGNENHGEMEGTKPSPGKFGGALRFTGKANPAGYIVKHHWTQDLPLFARAMMLSDGVIFAAGPRDLVNEEKAFRFFDLAETQETLSEQAAHMQGKRGAVLWAVRADSGEKVGELDLDVCPVFDGMAAAGERLYITNRDGSVICLEGE